MVSYKIGGKDNAPITEKDFTDFLTQAAGKLTNAQEDQILAAHYQAVTVNKYCRRLLEDYRNLLAEQEKKTAPVEEQNIDNDIDLDRPNARPVPKQVHQGDY